MDDGQICLAPQHEGKRTPKNSVVLDKQNPDHWCCGKIKLKEAPWFRDEVTGSSAPCSSRIRRER